MVSFDGSFDWVCRMVSLIFSTLSLQSVLASAVIVQADAHSSSRPVPVSCCLIRHEQDDPTFLKV